MPKVKINDTEIEVPAGVNMIEAARLAGIEIPHYCYHPHLSIAGNCRMCLVDIVGGRGPDIACNMQAREGLAIRTDTPAVVKMRQSVMEFLLVNHPLDCPICDQSGECRLQDYYMDYGQYESRLNDAKVSKTKRQDIGEHIVLDAERCVQCSRCVRFGDEVTKTSDLQLMNRGNHTEIGMFPDTQLEHGYQGNLADICPVGALTNKDFRFQRRVWYLKETDSVCNQCASGCNIKVCHQDGEVFRYLPRRNDAVNKSWMCDFGRGTYTEVMSLRRLLKAKIGGKEASVEAALNEAARLLKTGPVGVVLGTRATNEANWGLLSCIRANLPGAAIFWVEGNETEGQPADNILVDADKNPNTAGVKLLSAHDGKVGDKEALLEALAGLKYLLVLQDDVLARLGPVKLPTVIYLGSYYTLTAEEAHIIVPLAHTVEQDGSYTNRQNRVQRLRRALNPAGESLPGYMAADKLGALLGKAPGTAMPAAAFNSMARAIAAMKGMEFKGLGEGGLELVGAGI
jgi:NADH-quinone oxidoreductase subunit G